MGNKTFVPLKTHDVVQHGGDTYLVKSVKLTKDGPILELLPVKQVPIVVHASEARLIDSREQGRRAKSLGIMTSTKATLDLPDGLSPDEATQALKQYAAMKARNQQG